MDIKTENLHLMFGDCLERMQDIPDNSIDMVLTDPPYGTTRCKWDSVIDIVPMWSQLKRIIKPNGAIVMTAQTPFDKVLGASNLDMLRYEWIWEKTSATGFFNAKKMPMKSHENVLVFYEKLPTYNPQKTTGHKRKTAGRDPIHSDVYGKSVKKTQYDSTERYPRSVQIFPRDTQKTKLHSTQKPVALGEYFIKTYSDIGDTILDFCMGSGSFGVSSINTGRKFIGIDDDPDHYSTACNRLLQCTG